MCIGLILRLAGGLAACVLVAGTAPAQDYPSRALTIIVPYASGSVPDLVARVVAEKLAPALGQPVRVEARPGSNGNIGAAAVAQSAPDGYTLLVAEGTLLTVNPYVYRNLPFNAERDLTPVAPLGESTLFLAVNAALPIVSLPEFVAHARRATTPLAYASAGVGSQPHVAMERLRLVAGIVLLHVPYRTSPQAVAAALGGDVAAVVAGSHAFGFLHSGRLKPLAVGSATRSKTLPDVPSLSEYFPGLEITLWHAVFARAATPGAVLERLENELERMLAQPELSRRLAAAFDLHPMTLTRLQFAEKLRREREQHRLQLAQLGIVLE